MQSRRQESRRTQQRGQTEARKSRQYLADPGREAPVTIVKPFHLGGGVRWKALTTNDDLTKRFDDFSSRLSASAVWIMAPATAGVQAMETGNRSAEHLAAFRRIYGMGAPDSGGFGRKQMESAVIFQARGTAFSARSLPAEGPLPPEGLPSPATGKKPFPVKEASQRTGFWMSEGFPYGSGRVQQRMSQQTKEFPTRSKDRGTGASSRP